jgi:hypothetical protein
MKIARFSPKVDPFFPSQGNQLRSTAQTGKIWEENKTIKS